MITENEYAVLNAIMVRNSLASRRQICEKVLMRNEVEVNRAVDMMLDKKLLLVVEERRKKLIGLSMAGFTAWNNFGKESV